MAEMVMVPLPTEPVEIQESLKAAEPMVRRASLKQASDIVTPIYRCWKDQLQVGGLSWQFLPCGRFKQCGGVGELAGGHEILADRSRPVPRFSSTSIEASIGFGWRWTPQ